MIIKNNFETRNDLLKKDNDYQSIGSTRTNNLDDKNPFIRENEDNTIIKDIMEKDNEYEEEDNNQDKWKFFR